MPRPKKLTDPMKVIKKDVQEIVSEFPCALTKEQHEKINELYGITLYQDKYHSAEHLVALIQEEIDFNEPLPTKTCSLDDDTCESCQ